MGKKITLEDFIKKATDRYNKRKKVVEIEIKGVGTLVFKRPTDSELLEFKDTLANSVKMSKGSTSKGSTIDKLDYKKMLEASKELVYKSCEYLHNTELMQDLDCAEPYDIPIKIFGIDGTIELAQRINEEFEDINADVEKTIKNS
ncbi:hypothetical protein ACTQ4P_05645 [Clostridium sporogenes]|uniref:hypothetical protein n=1 Tax=Clostridium sporogenes TaxID=1509 RepID=UPI0029041A63|nr:hypothetical protein [Clostridium botulinum]